MRIRRLATQCNPSEDVRLLAAPCAVAVMNKESAEITSSTVECLSLLTGEFGLRKLSVRFAELKG
jgi:hypothetical protein